MWPHNTSPAVIMEEIVFPVWPVYYALCAEPDFGGSHLLTVTHWVCKMSTQDSSASPGEKRAKWEGGSTMSG